MTSINLNQAGTFDIPAREDQSCNGARKAFVRAFGWEWPMSDGELRELARLAEVNR